MKAAQQISSRVSLQLREARHGEVPSEGFHLPLELSYPLLVLLSVGQGLSEVLQGGLGVQAGLDLQGQLDACRTHHTQGVRQLYNSPWLCSSHIQGQRSPLWMKSATFLKWSSSRPLEVRAGEPSLRPLGRSALLSPADTTTRLRTHTHTRAHTHTPAVCYLGRCSCCRQWHMLPEPSQPVLRLSCWVSGPAGPGGYQSLLETASTAHETPEEATPQQRQLHLSRGSCTSAEAAAPLPSAQGSSLSGWLVTSHLDEGSEVISPCRG